VLAGDVMYKLKISVAYFCSEYTVTSGELTDRKAKNKMPE